MSMDNDEAKEVTAMSDAELTRAIRAEARALDAYLAGDPPPSISREDMTGEQLRAAYEVCTASVRTAKRDEVAGNTTDSPADANPLVDDGGPAFPEVRDEFDHEFGEHGELRIVSSGGMSLRDYFAAKAMAAVILIPDGDYDYDEAVVAENAYKQADAMLKARSA
jgi:hypothetical protein